MQESPFLAIAFFLVALFFASAGHAGASGYLAVMSLAGVAPETLRPTALVINVLIAAVATWRYQGAGCLSWRLLLPFVVTSIPCAFLGGMLTLPSQVFHWTVGVVLLYAAWRIAARRLSGLSPSPRPPSAGVALACGGAIGLLSGLIGAGGGIFLSPLLLMAGWADARQTAGTSAAFILVNSIAALSAQAPHLPSLSPAVFGWATAALLGGALGAELGSRMLAPRLIQTALSVILLIAGVKMFVA